MIRRLFGLLIASLLLLACGHSKDPRATRGHAGGGVCPHHGGHHGGPGRGDPLHGFSAERLGRIEESMRGHVENGHVAGVVTLVARHGEIVHRTVIGHRDLEAEQPMREDTIFRVYSMSKPITSVAVMILVEEGRLRLTDPVDEWLPELANPRVLLDPSGPLDETRPAQWPITVRDLLTHSSGLGYEFTSQGSLSEAIGARGLLGSSTELDPDEWMRRLGELPLLWDPGTVWHYGLSTDVLGVLVERVSEMPFAEFLEARLFAPLGMVDTAFYVPADRIDRFAVNYARDAETDALVVVDHPDSSDYASPPAFASGGGGLVSTANDYLRFARMMTAGGSLDGVRILSPKGVELMTSNALWPGERPDAPFGARFFMAGTGFGLGVSVLEDPGLSAQYGSVGQNGWGGAAGTWYWSDPAEGISAVMMIQLMRGRASDRMAVDFQKAVYQALERTRSRRCGRCGRGRR